MLLIQKSTKKHLKRTYANDPGKFKKASKKAYKKTQKGINKPLKTTIMSTEKKCVLRKENTMYCGHLMKPL